MVRELPLSSSICPAATAVTELVRQAGGQLGNRLEAELLLAHALDVERAWLYAHGEAKPSQAQRVRFQALIERRRHGEPLAYMLGYREFYGRPFKVNQAVLIPRPETELLVDTALEIVRHPEATIVDVGTGSGCIALTLAAERPRWRVAAVDVSANALAVCRRNAELLQRPRVEMLQGDLLAPVAERRFHAIVSNPPYVAAGDPHLAQGDLRFEPDVALSAGDHGLGVIRRLIEQARHLLWPGGWLLIEHGYDQALPIQQLFAGAGFEQLSTRKDLADIERVTLGAWPLDRRA